MRTIFSVEEEEEGMTATRDPPPAPGQKRRKTLRRHFNFKPCDTHRQMAQHGAATEDELFSILDRLERQEREVKAVERLVKPCRRIGARKRQALQRQFAFTPQQEAEQMQQRGVQDTDSLYVELDLESRRARQLEQRAQKRRREEQQRGGADEDQGQGQEDSVAEPAAAAAPSVLEPEQELPAPPPPRVPREHQEGLIVEKTQSREALGKRVTELIGTVVTGMDAAALHAEYNEMKVTIIGGKEVDESSVPHIAQLVSTTGDLQATPMFGRLKEKLLESLEAGQQYQIGVTAYALFCDPSKATLFTRFVNAGRFQQVQGGRNEAGTSEADDLLKEGLRRIDIQCDLAGRSEGNPSGIRFVGYYAVRVVAVRYQPTVGRRYLTLPRPLREQLARAGGLNVRNAGSGCFYAAVAACLCANGCSPDACKLVTSGHGGPPCTRDQFAAFERDNNLSLNVWAVESDAGRAGPVSPQLYYGTRHFPVDVTPPETRFVNLLLIKKRVQQQPSGCVEVQGHYACVPDFARFLGPTIRSDRHKVPCCHVCCKVFPGRPAARSSGPSPYELHIRDNYSLCRPLLACRPVADGGAFHQQQQHTAHDMMMPSEAHKSFSFKNHKNTLALPFCVVADIEALLVVPDEAKTGGSKQKQQKQQQQVLHQHQPFAAGISFLDRHMPDNSHMATITSRDPLTLVGKTMDMILRFAQHASAVVRNAPFKNEIHWTPGDFDAHRRATACAYCERGFGEGEAAKCADHDHLTGRYRCAACRACNRKVNFSGFRLPVFMHNLRGYDGHHIFANMHAWAVSRSAKISVLAQSSEKYQCIRLVVPGAGAGASGSVTIEFKDSYSFLQDSLDRLVGAMKASGRPLPRTARFLKERYGVEDPATCAALTSKGAMPYEWLDCFEKLSCCELPPREAFASRLRGSTSGSAAEYEHAQRCWAAFGCRTMMDYVRAYLELDVLLLSDLFEDYRDQTLGAFGLDPARYVSMPGLSLDCALRVTGASLELLTCAKMHAMIEGAMRGGVSMVSKRHSVANHPGLATYDPAKPHVWIKQVDANSLYPWAMKQPLPVGGFRWVEDLGRFATPDGSRCPVRSAHQYCEGVLAHLSQHPGTGMFLEVDLHYPPALHDSHSDLPLAPEHLVITEADLSDYNRACLAALSGKDRYRERKLVPNLRDKERYTVHHEALRLYMRLGLVVTRVHRIIEFKQAPWMRPYIEYCESKRSAAGTEYDATYWKNAMNVVYGKLMENVRKRVRVKVLTTPAAGDRRAAMQLDRVLSDTANMKEVTIHHKDLVTVICNGKSRAMLNTPIAVGVAVLDLAKVHMYEHWYDVYKARYGAAARLLCTDTDSLTVEVSTHDLDADFQRPGFRERLDFSNYPRDHPLHDASGARVPGLFKDETKGTPIYEFVGLCAKMYALRMQPTGEEEGGSGCCVVTKSKGISKRSVHWGMYVDALRDRQAQCITQTHLRSSKHVVQTRECRMRGPSPLDTKRFVLHDGLDSVALGHHATTHTSSVKGVEAPEAAA